MQFPFADQAGESEVLPAAADGLADAVVPSLRGLAAGWVGAATHDRADGVYGDVPVKTAVISSGDYDLFYNGFSNSTIWPLFHDNLRAPQFRADWWRAYQAVNESVAASVASLCERPGRIWIHDYHLQLVPELVRRLRGDVRIGYFHHIPFPPVELFAQLPWRDQLVHGLLGADLVGFQTTADANNFVAAVRRFVRVRGSRSRLRLGGREIEVGVFPTTIDTNKVRATAMSPATQRRALELRLQLGRPDIVLLGVDRLDYAKGIDQRLRALQQLLRRGVLDPTRCVMVQVGVPGSAIGDSADTREHIEQLVSEINGEFATVGRPIVHYIRRSVPFDELIALYSAADVMIVTPLREGMNLVAKEYVASRVDSAGALVLSEFAGAAHELTAAYLVNPHDVDSLSAGIEAASARNPVEHARRMRSMQRVVMPHDAHEWASAFLNALR